jgi:hypothetical protein
LHPEHERARPQADQLQVVSSAGHCRCFRVSLMFYE